MFNILFYSMPKLTLCYFNGRGKAEPTRYMLKMAGVDFEDKRIGGDDWKNTWKPSELKTFLFLQI